MLEAWPGLSLSGGGFASGLINTTLRATRAGEPLVLQRLHPVFAPHVHDDIEAVTAHLAARGRETPRLVRTAAGSLYTLDGEGRPWRVLTFVPGAETFDKLTLEGARHAGALVAGFHAALADLSYRYTHVRPGVHDLPFRSAALAAARAAHEDHRLAAEVARLAARADALAPLLLAPEGHVARHAHGDLKASNLLFDAATGRGRCLCDLDTLASMIWPFEMGDALRSWCNPRAEDDPTSAIDVAFFARALEGYAEGLAASGAAPGDVLDARDARALPRGVLTIALELALRFLADALEERYFGFDAARYVARGEHNLARARGQLALAESIAARQAELEAIAVRALR